MVERFRLAQKPQGVPCGNPVVPVVLGVAVACDDFVAIGKGAVHFCDVLRTEEVIGIEDKVAVKGVAVILLNLVQ